MTRTPWVLRPTTLIPSTPVRTRVPESEISMTSSPSSTRSAPTTSPLRAVALIAMSPCPPRPWTRNSSTGVRFPKPLAVTDSTCPAPPATMSEMTRSSLPSRIPRTPREVRPMARTSCSRNRIALPPFEKSMTSRSPSVRSAPARESPSSRCTAMIPALRGRENASSRVFLTTPPRVAMTT